MNPLEALYSLLIKFFSMLAVVLLPVRPIMIAVSVLVIADLITGIWASKKEGKKITSTGLKKSVVKSLVYQASIVIAFVIETYLLPEMPIVKVIGALIGMTEGKSFFENVHRITGIDFWSEIMKKVGGSMKILPDDKDKQ